MNRIAHFFKSFLITGLNEVRPFFSSLRASLHYPDTEIGRHAIITGSSMGKRTRLDAGSLIVNSTVGDYTYIGMNSFVRNAKIGKFCSIANHVRVGLFDHPIDYVSTYPGFHMDWSRWTPFLESSKKEFPIIKDVVIGNDVWIGENVIIRGGIKIGNGAVLATGAIIVKDVPPYAIVGGCPAKIIRYRFTKEQIEAVEQTKWWDKSEAWLQRSAASFSSIDLFLDTGNHE